MRLGALTSNVIRLEPEDGLDHLVALGLEAVEVAAGGYFGHRYCDPRRLVSAPAARSQWLDAYRRRNLEITALALHGEPLAPDSEAARDYAEELRAACRLAEQIGVARLTLLAGLPEGDPGDSTPCWITQPFPPAASTALEWQWQERLLPYWHEHGRLAGEHGCRLCFEMVPADMIYNPRALLRLRAEVGEVVGCNFDPSHLFWQGINPLEALRALGPAVFHVHGKDVVIDEHISRVHGVLDPTAYDRIGERAWTFRTVGYGHGEDFWRAFVSALRAIGYDDVISIEHEDEYFNSEDGLAKAVAFLRPLLPAGERATQWWDET